MSDENKTPPASPVSDQKGPQPANRGQTPPSPDKVAQKPAQKPRAQSFGDPSGSEIRLHPASVAVKIELPSRGLLYPGGTPSEVFIKEMRMREMMMLQTPALWNENRVFSQIFENCVSGLPDGFTVLDLFSADKNAVLVALRILSFGSVYKVRVRCPRRTCAHEYDHHLDLEKDLDVKYLEEGELEYPLVIPADWLKCKREIKMRLMTFRDEIEIDKKADAALDKGSIVNTRLKDQLIATTLEIQELDPTMKTAFIESMTGMDTSVLDQVSSEMYFGMEDEFQATACPKCGEIFKSTMPINENFFRATLPKTRSLAAT